MVVFWSLHVALAASGPVVLVVDTVGVPVTTAVVASDAARAPVDAAGLWAPDCAVFVCDGVHTVRVSATGFRTATVAVPRRGRAKVTLAPLDRLPSAWAYGAAADGGVAPGPITEVRTLAGLPPDARAAWDALLGDTAEAGAADWDPSCGGGARPRFLLALHAGRRWVFAVERGGFGVEVETVLVEQGATWTWLDTRGFEGGTDEAVWRAALGWGA